MATFFIFILKSAFVLALLVSLFMLFMSRETFHRINRLIMLSILGIALLLPVMNLGIESPFKSFGNAIEGYFAEETATVALAGGQEAVFDFGELVPAVTADAVPAEVLSKMTLSACFYLLQRYISLVLHCLLCVRR